MGFGTFGNGGNSAKKKVPSFLGNKWSLALGSTNYQIPNYSVAISVLLCLI